MNQKIKDAIMDAVYVQLERDDMQTPCTLPFMTSSEHGVCDGDGFPVSDETIASALSAVAKIQTEYYKVKKGTQKETQKGTQKEMTDEASPRPWHTENFINGIEDANNGKVAANIRDADAKLIVDAVNYYKPDLHCDWRELTPEEAVAHCREVAARLGDTPCARDHLQLAAWIEERDRLRDIVRRFVDLFTPGTIHPAGTMERLLREARAAIGEDKE